MKLSIANDNGHTVQLKVPGKVTQHDFGPVHEPLGQLLGPTAYQRHVCLDLSDASYMDSSGVAWLLTCHKRIREAGGRLTLQNVHPVIANMLRLLKLDKVFDPDRSAEGLPEAGGLA